jgi:hypothetical protein
VNAWLGASTVPSGIVTSEINCSALQFEVAVTGTAVGSALVGKATVALGMTDVGMLLVGEGTSTMDVGEGGIWLAGGADGRLQLESARATTINRMATFAGFIVFILLL